MTAHQTRAHSKFSASGSERWLNCAASVRLEEQSPPSKDNPWSLEGTEAHEVLEVLFKMHQLKSFKSFVPAVSSAKDAMISNALKMVKKVDEVRAGLADPELLVEARVYNSEIHPEMFGTVDAALVEPFGELHVFDYKYGQGHIVDPKENTQMIQYALGLAEKYEWNFTEVVVHICQPRGAGGDDGNGHKAWRLTINKLMEYRDMWRKGVARVESGTSKPFAGHWCHWCRAKSICPVKVDAREEKIAKVFESEPLTERPSNGGKKESKQKSVEEKELEAFYKKRAKKESQSKKKNPFESEGDFY